jgi:hypothetical protein
MRKLRRRRDTTAALAAYWNGPYHQRSCKLPGNGVVGTYPPLSASVEPLSMRTALPVINGRTGTCSLRKPRRWAGGQRRRRRVLPFVCSPSIRSGKRNAEKSKLRLPARCLLHQGVGRRQKPERDSSPCKSMCRRKLGVRLRRSALRKGSAFPGLGYSSDFLVYSEAAHRREAQPHG